MLELYSVTVFDFVYCYINFDPFKYFMELNNIDEKEEIFQFIEESHTYLLGNKKITSVTTIIDRELFEHFDEQKVVVSMLKGRSKIEKSESRWKGMTKKAILAAWKLERETSIEAGKLIHLYLEIYYKNILNKNKNSLEPQSLLPDIPKYEKKILNEFIKDRETIEPIEFELRMFDKENNYAGTLDALFKLKNKYYIYDWKRIKKLSKSNEYSRCLVPGLEWIENCNYWKYAIQLNFYKRLVEKTLNIKVSGMRIIIFNKIEITDKHFQYEVVKIPNMSNEIDKILEWRKKRNYTNNL